MGRWNKYIQVSLALHLAILALIGFVVQQKLPQAPSNRHIQIDLVPLDDGQGKGGTTGSIAGKTQEASAGMMEAGKISLPELDDTVAEPVSKQPAFPDHEIKSSNSHGTDARTGPESSIGGHKNPDGKRPVMKAASRQDVRVLSFSKQYPLSAWQNGEEGSCLVQVDVSAAGKVTGARLLSSTGYDRLDQAAIRSAFQSSYAPARDENGSPVPGRLNVPVQYKLTDGPS